MSIRPVDFNGMLQNSQDVTNLQRQEDNRSIMQQHNLASQIEQESFERPHKVNEKDDADGAKMKDAKDKGNSAYSDGRKKKQDKKAKEDKIVLKSKAHSFDIKI